MHPSSASASARRAVTWGALWRTNHLAAASFPRRTVASSVAVGSAAMATSACRSNCQEITTSDMEPSRALVCSPTE